MNDESYFSLDGNYCADNNIYVSKKGVGVFLFWLHLKMNSNLELSFFNSKTSTLKLEWLKLIQKSEKPRTANEIAFFRHIFIKFTNFHVSIVKNLFDT